MKHRAKRFPANRHIAVVAGGKRISGRLRNVSLSGARIVLGRAMPPRSHIEFTTSTGIWDGWIVWCRGTEMGLRFDVPLTHAELRILQMDGAPPPVMRTKPPRFSSARFAHR